MAAAIAAAGGEEAMLMRIAEAYLEQLRKLSNDATEVVLPMDLTDITGVVDALRGALQPPAGRPTTPAAPTQVAARDG